jgi:hypothetical protein
MDCRVKPGNNKPSNLTDVDKALMAETSPAMTVSLVVADFPRSHRQHLPELFAIRIVRHAASENAVRRGRHCFVAGRTHGAGVCGQGAGCGRVGVNGARNSHRGKQGCRDESGRK